MLDDFKTQRAVEVVVGEGVVSAYVFIGPDGFVLFRLDVGRVEAPQTSECFFHYKVKNLRNALLEPSEPISVTTGRRVVPGPEAALAATRELGHSIKRRLRRSCGRPLQPAGYQCFSLCRGCFPGQFEPERRRATSQRRRSQQTSNDRKLATNATSTEPSPEPIKSRSWRRSIPWH